METKHTPGDWHIAKVEDAMLARTRSIEVHDATGSYICHIDRDNLKGYPKTEAQANARLIAAAPELLEALRRFLTLLPSEEGLGGYAPIGAFVIAGDYARAAIAKSEGR
jgi:hypothetical protein